MSDKMNAAIALASKLTQSAEEFSPAEAPAMCDVLAKGLLDAVELIKGQERLDAMTDKVEALALALYVKSAPDVLHLDAWAAARTFYGVKSKPTNISQFNPRMIGYEIKGTPLGADEGLRELVREAIGEGSVCWENIAGAGVFDTARAGDVVDRLVAAIRSRQKNEGVSTDACPSELMPGGDTVKNPYPPKFCQECKWLWGNCVGYPHATCPRTVGGDRQRQELLEDDPVERQAKYEYNWGFSDA